jgi:RNase P/RNase MRP subunit p29
MSDVKHVRFLRGTAAQNDAFTGLEGQVTVDTTNKQLRLHDGVTPGGKVIIGKSDVDIEVVKLTGNQTIAGSSYPCKR